MSDYQCTQRLLAALGRWDDLRDHANLLTRRRQDWLTRGLPLPDEKGDQMAAEAAAEVMKLAPELDETFRAALRFVAKQGLDSLLVQKYLFALFSDLGEVYNGMPCENRTQRHSADVQHIVAHALFLGNPSADVSQMKASW
jgi:hypothetical protein